MTDEFNSPIQKRLASLQKQIRHKALCTFSLVSRSFPIPRPLHRARASFSSTACLEPHASRASGYRAGHLSWARFNHRRPYRAYCRGCDISTLEENVTVVIVYVWLVLGWSEKCALTSVSLARIFFVAHFLFCVLSVWQLRRLWGLKGNTLTIMWWVLWSFSTIFHRKKIGLLLGYWEFFDSVDLLCSAHHEVTSFDGRIFQFSFFPRFPKNDILL